MEGLTVNFGEMELNGNCSLNRSNSLDDLSEYTDADESISAPTEILAEFLSAVMLKDYEAALKYCKIILQYEPNHTTAREFYPLIRNKISTDSQSAVSRNDDSEASSSSRDNESDDEDMSDEYEYSSGSGVDSSGGLGHLVHEPRSADSDATSASYSSLEDEEAGHVTLSQKKLLRTSKRDNDFIENGNNTTSSDSESPTEPDSQTVLSSTNFPVNL